LAGASWKKASSVSISIIRAEFGILGFGIAALKPDAIKQEHALPCNLFLLFL
jgi:hypothetical protein